MKNESTSTKEPNNSIEPDMSKIIEMEKQKVNILMRNFKKTLVNIDANPSAEEIGALYGIGYQVLDEQVFCMIYIYENQSYHEAARAYLNNKQPQEIKKTLTSSNGRLFFWGYTTSDEVSAGYQLNDLAAAFAGDE